MSEQNGTPGDGETAAAPESAGAFDARSAALDTAIAADVVVFGAGITGLTLAHELAERNFKVVVVDPNFDPGTPFVLRGHNENPGVGGVARSQWGFTANDPMAQDDPQSPIPVKDMIQTERASMRFGPVRIGVSVINREVKPSLPSDLADLEDGIYRSLFALRDIDGARISVTLRVWEISPQPDPSAALGQVFGMFRRIRAARDLPERLDARLTLDRAVIRTLRAGPGEPEDLTFEPNVFALPGEHGFRFFPSFYRHVFDTLRRIPATLPPETLAGERDELPEAGRRGRDTVFDNLVSVRNVGYVGEGEGRSAIIPRPKIRSAEEARRVISDLLRETGYSGSDLARLGLKVWKYATSARRRREAEYEHLSWFDFVEGERFSERGQFLLNSTPGTLGGLFGADADARTQGTVLLQCMRDHSDEGLGADMLLNGPTDEAWFAHWYRYLRRQQVEFVRGRLVDFARIKGEIVPVVMTEPLPASGVAPVPIAFKPSPQRVAHPVIGQRVVYALAAALVEAHALAERYLAVADASGFDASPSLRDLRALKAFPERSAEQLALDLREAYPQGPLRHLSGVQYFFAQPVRFFAAHTQFLDAPSGLTAVAQPQFWLNPQSYVSGFRSVLSVDIGIWRAAPGSPPSTWSAWGSSRRGLALNVWAQVCEGHRGDYPGRWPRLPTPTAYRVDEHLEFESGREGRLIGDRAPFLVNVTGRFRARPGGAPDDTHPSGVRLAYDLAHGGLVLAGTYMQTRTRINSMEAACESARHAVNAVLRAIDHPGDPCEIWDPEDHEDDSMLADREIDDALFERGMPHMSEILGVDRLDAWLPPDHDPRRR